MNLAKNILFVVIGVVLTVSLYFGFRYYKQFSGQFETVVVLGLDRATNKLYPIAVDQSGKITCDNSAQEKKEIKDGK